MNQIFRAAAIIAALMSANVGADSNALERPQAQSPVGLTQTTASDRAPNQLTDEVMSKITAGRQGCGTRDPSRIGFPADFRSFLNDPKGARVPGFFPIARQ